MTKRSHLLVALPCFVVLSVRAPAAEPSPTKITGARRLEDTVARLGCSGDNWHMTWAADDRMLAGLCDGFAEPWPKVPHKPFNSRLLSIRGVPPKIDVDDIPGYPEILVGPGLRNCSRYYGFGVLAVDGTIYQFLSTPNRPFDTALPHPRFVGAKLIYSPDNGVTWHNQDGSTPVKWEVWEDRSHANMIFFEEPGDAFLAAHRAANGSGLRGEQDGYVYIYSPNGSTEGTMNQLVLARVKKDRILDRKAYEFFVARRPDGSAEWSPDMAARGVVQHVSFRLGEHTDPSRMPGIRASSTTSRSASI